MENVLNAAGPFLAIIAMPLLFWPVIMLVVAIVKQARAEMILKPRHIAIFIAVQVVWLLLIFGLSSALILRPLNIRL